MSISKKTLKKVALSLLIVVSIAALTTGLLAAFSSTRNAGDPEPNTAQSFIQAGDEATRSAIQHEQGGNTQAALDDYKKALFAYEQAGDSEGQESVKLQIAYLERLLKQ